MSPLEEHEPSTKTSSACWMPRHVRQQSWPSWAPDNDHIQKRTGDKTSLKRRDHRVALLVLKHAGELATAHSRHGCQQEDDLFSLPCDRDHRCCAVTPALVFQNTLLWKKSSCSSARLQSERMINAVLLLPRILTLWSAAAVCMSMSIGSFSYTWSGYVSLARSQFRRSSDVTRSDRLKGN